jgi:hypothetical protein
MRCEYGRPNDKFGKDNFFSSDINCLFFSQHVRWLSGLKPDARMLVLVLHYEYRSPAKRPHMICRCHPLVIELTM